MRNGLCILLVEDDPVLGPVTALALDALGHDSVLATSARALHEHLARRHTFDIVVLDLQLVDQRSEPVIVGLRASGAIIPPIIVFSALPIDHIHAAARLVGASAFVQKPASIDDLSEAIIAARG